MSILVIGDTHFHYKRKKAIGASIDSIKKVISNYMTTSEAPEFDNIIFLGDIYDRNPTIEDRLIFAEFFKYIRNWSTSFSFILGTNTHEYTKGIYHLEDTCKLFNILKHKTYTSGNFMFVHEDIKGAKYPNGFLTEKGRSFNLKSTQKVIAGHYHSGYDADPLYYLGSVYKKTFSEIKDTKRILIIEDDKLNFIPIESRPMYEINMLAKQGKITCENIKNIKEKECDLKVNVYTDKETLPDIHRTILKLKNKLNIEYYQENIQVDSQQVEWPRELNETVLLKKYCKEKNINHELILKEFE